MPHDRYYHEGPLTTKITLLNDEHTHLFKVMRKNPGDVIELIDGRGTLATGQIEKIDKKQAIISIQSSIKEEPLPEKILALSITKQPKLEIAVEKCTELGITKFILFPAEKSERTSLSQNHLNRLYSISLSATKQCGRLYLPSFELLSKMPKLENSAFATLLEGTSPLQSISAVYIGPEKGWSKSEEEFLASFAKKATLHKNVLRAETAAIAAAVQISLP